MASCEIKLKLKRSEQAISLSVSWKVIHFRTALTAIYFFFLGTTYYNNNAIRDNYDQNVPKRLFSFLFF